jgi:UDP-N-acetylglucosamine 2-epimerase (non-hydrolysing)
LEQISKILNKLGIDYIRKYIFDNYKGTKKPLQFDFYLPKYNCCIQYEGEEYFIKKNGTFKNELENIRENETQYCKDNDIKLIRIPYGFYKKIEKILTIEFNNNFQKSTDYTNCILIIAGTRPEEIKTIKLREFFEKNSIPHLYVFTGQHKNLINKNKYDFLFNIKEIKESNRLDRMLIENINNFGKFFCKHPYIKYVLVQGDTTSALAVALCSFNHQIKIIHLEAGLRTYDRENPYPEETNRRIISQMADIHLCPTYDSMNNLNKENVGGLKFVVGNTVIDNLLPYKDKCEYTNKILVTLHRRENHHWIDRWFTELDNLAKNYPQYDFILPMHPNPNVQKYKYLLKHVNIINPLPYEELLDLLVKTRLVITDSGGLQEECSFFNKKCLTCRIITERPEAINQSTFMVEEPEKLKSVFKEHHNNYKITHNCPFGDGRSVEKIFTILKELC